MKKLYVLGIGPGNECNMSKAAISAMTISDALIGYTKYIELVRPIFPDKETFTTGMKKEIDRCRKALEMANTGKTITLLCSGDAGVYGMAGPIFELSPSYPEVDIEVVPGITAALSGAAVLGAPLTHDFAVISLSDLLTPWDKIALRLRCAAEADFCIVIYNPSSKNRVDYLSKACDILLSYKSPRTICGYVKNIGRDGQYRKILTLSDLKSADVDMFTTVFIGNQSTKVISNHMVTPRGYIID
ncbi:precorrin-3B C(17)-methyltransferase [Mogibacterium sp.]